MLVKSLLSASYMYKGVKHIKGDTKEVSSEDGKYLTDLETAGGRPFFKKVKQSKADKATAKAEAKKVGDAPEDLVDAQAPLAKDEQASTEVAKPKEAVVKTTPKKVAPKQVVAKKVEAKPKPKPAVNKKPDTSDGVEV